jgi:hypothetical protein
MPSIVLFGALYAIILLATGYLASRLIPLIASGPLTAAMVVIGLLADIGAGGGVVILAFFGARDLALYTFGCWLLTAILRLTYYLLHGARVARRSEASEALRYAPVLLLRPFEADVATSSVQDLVYRSVTNYRPNDAWGFTLNAVALGDEDDAAFPKLTTSDEQWWQDFLTILRADPIIFVVPIIVSEDPSKGLNRELKCLMGEKTERLFLLIPPRRELDKYFRKCAQTGATEGWSTIQSRFAVLFPDYRLPDLTEGGCIYRVSTRPTKRPAIEFCGGLTRSQIRHLVARTTTKRRAESLMRKKEFEREFEQLNDAPPGRYYDGTKKLPPQLPQ